MPVSIVAIPSVGDRIWDISSEKIPHLTIMTFGETVEDPKHIIEYVQHATSKLSVFAALTTDRQKLGKNNADVVMLDVKDGAPIREFRRHLLQNDMIYREYHSVEQFPEWLPHITLGYPDTPAPEEANVFPIPYVVTFDRIAVWTGDYQGPEFELTDTIGLTKHTQSLGEKVLSHYGVKGMRWGVIRDTVTTGITKAYTPSEDAISTQKVMLRAKVGGVSNLSDKELQRTITRMNLERQYKELYGERQLTRRGARWAANFLTDVLKDAAGSWIRNPFSNPAPNTTYRTKAFIDMPALDSKASPLVRK